MPESSHSLNQKTGELQAAVDEVERELARADASRRTEAHERLAAAVSEARDWLRACAQGQAEGEGGAGAVRRAEALLHEIRMRRDAI